MFDKLVTTEIKELADDSSEKHKVVSLKLSFDEDVTTEKVLEVFAHHSEMTLTNYKAWNFVLCVHRWDFLPGEESSTGCGHKSPLPFADEGGSNAPPPEGSLLTQQEREESMRSAGQLQRATDQPVSIFAAMCIAQDAKTTESMKAQVDAAEADSERSMAAYKELYSTMLRFDTVEG
jgi:hypothetical protein